MTVIKYLSFRNCINYTLHIEDIIDKCELKTKFPFICTDKIQTMEEKCGSIISFFDYANLTTADSFVSIVKLDADDDEIYILKNAYRAQDYK